MTDLVLGIICVLYGVFTVIARIIKPGMFSKLNRMKEAYGEKAATTFAIAVGISSFLEGSAFNAFSNNVDAKS